MKYKNKELDEETLERLQEQGILFRRNAPPLNKEQALVLIGEAMLENIAKQINELIGLWKNELFPNCRLQDFEASEEEKQHILSERDADEDRNSMPTKEDEAGIAYWDLITMKPKRKPVKAGYQLISDLWKNGRVVYLPGKKKSLNYKQHNEQQLLPSYVKHYQLPKRVKPYSYGRIRLPSLHKSFGKLGKNTRNLSPFAKMPQLYQRQIGGKSFELVAGYKSLESYLTDYNEVVENEI
jgi:hypothetical protein